ncbi:hypothetical protein LguiB_016376 [Lonicera macranthoides]
MWAPNLLMGNNVNITVELTEPKGLPQRAGLKHMKLERVKKFEYCLPSEAKPIFCEFDWELDELEEFTDKLIEEEELTEDQKDAFKDFVKEKVREGKKANREAREARRKALAEMSEETKAAFEKMRFYKFYPVPSPDTPDVSSVKVKWKEMYERQKGFELHGS